MVLIPLTRGQFALIDDEDYDDLSKFKWQARWSPGTKSYYALRGLRLPNGKTTTRQMSRQILGLERGDKRECDHIYHDTLDNRRDMIRIVTGAQNNHNRHAKGYHWSKASRKYVAQIQVDRIQRHLGYYDTPDEARAAYLAAKRQYHPSAPPGMFL